MGHTIAGVTLPCKGAAAFFVPWALTGAKGALRFTIVLKVGYAVVPERVR